MQFFVSFLSIQLYVFFFHVITKLSKWKRVLAAFWTVSLRSLHKYMEGKYFLISFNFSVRNEYHISDEDSERRAGRIFAICYMFDHPNDDPQQGIWRNFL